MHGASLSSYVYREITDVYVCVKMQQEILLNYCTYFSANDSTIENFQGVKVLLDSTRLISINNNVQITSRSHFICIFNNHIKGRIDLLTGSTAFSDDGVKESILRCYQATS